MKKTLFKYLLVIILPSLQAQEVCELSVKQFDSILDIAMNAARKNNVLSAIRVTDSIIKITKEAEPEGKDYVLGRAYNIVGMTNVFLDDKEQALYNFQKALKYASEIDNDKLKIQVLNSLGALYFVKYKNYQAALEYFYKGLEKAKKLNHTVAIDILSLNIAECLMYIDKYDKSIKYIQPILEKLDTKEDPLFKSFAYHLMALYYTHKELYKKSEEYYEKALEIDEPLNFHRGLYRNYTNASQMFATQKKHDTAYVLLTKALSIKDSLIDQQNKVQKAAIAAKFRLDEYQQSLNELKIENIQVTKKSNDGGIDGIINEDRLGLDVIYVQAKRWQHNIGRKEIQSFIGALAGKQAHKGIFITTSTFIQSAID